MPNPNQDDSGLTDAEEYDLEQAEIIAAAGGKAPVDTPAVPDAAAAATAVAEAEATRKGWRPKDKFEGDPKLWVDASTFLERGERFASNLVKEVQALKQKVQAFEGTKAAFAKFHEETIAKKDEELSAALKQLRVQRSEAQADGDHESAVALEDRIEVLKQEKAGLKEAAAEAAPVPTSQVSDPVLDEWIEDGNEWFRDDSKLQDYAVKLGHELIASGEQLRGRAFLNKVRTLMEEEFPRKFGNANRERGSAVESGSGRQAVAETAGKTERDLPKADRELMREFVAAGWITKEKFLADYFSRS